MVLGLKLYEICFSYLYDWTVEELQAEEMNLMSDTVWTGFVNRLSGEQAKEALTEILNFSRDQMLRTRGLIDKPSSVFTEEELATLKPQWGGEWTGHNTVQHHSMMVIERITKDSEWQNIDEIEVTKTTNEGVLGNHDGWAFVNPITGDQFKWVDAGGSLLFYIYRGGEYSWTGIADYRFSGDAETVVHDRIRALAAMARKQGKVKD
ncbi:hypothetical protein ABZV14_05870 [Streptosporangium canum]|uniref:hypothetical protein n=1 Tax=Streptosporangium canum TaxID=324952 RepID=UPI0033A292D6